MIKPGLYAIADREVARSQELTLEEFVWKLCEGGVSAIQYRDKEVSDIEFKQLARKLRTVVSRFGIPFIINDRVEIAAEVGADAVHLGQEDLEDWSILEVRKWNLKVGLSTHGLQQALAAEKMGVDYIGIGPVYATPTKPHYEEIGLREMARVCASVKIPTVAIGGINKNNIDEVQRQGAKIFAMVRGLQDFIL